MTTPPDPDWGAFGAPATPEERVKWALEQLPTFEELYTPVRQRFGWLLAGYLVYVFAGWQLTAAIEGLVRDHGIIDWVLTALWVGIIALNLWTSIRLRRAELQLYRSGLALMGSMAEYALHAKLRDGD